MTETQKPQASPTEPEHEEDQHAHEHEHGHQHGPNCNHGHHHHRHAQQPFVHETPKLGRNDPCSCGSGKKFKKCCAKN